MDVNGNICGIKEFEATSYAVESVNGVDIATPEKRSQPDLTNYPYLYPINLYGVGICVEKCPSVPANGTIPYIDPTIYVGSAGYTVNVPGSSPEYFPETFLPKNEDGTPVYNADSANFNNGRGYDFPVVDTTEFLGRCYLSTPAMDEFIKQYNSGDQSEEEEGVMTAFYGDMWTARSWVLGFGFVISVFVAFFYSYFLRIPGVLFIMIWGCIAAVFCMFAGMGAYCYNMATVTWEVEGDQHSQVSCCSLRWFCVL